MKLSEALRLGEFALKPSHGSWYEMRGEDVPCAGCAVGRLLYAAGCKLDYINDGVSELSAAMSALWPWTQKSTALPPDYAVTRSWATSYYRNYVNGYKHFNPILCIISDCYERGDWTISKIADFVATIEPQDAVEPALVQKSASCSVEVTI